MQSITRILATAVIGMTSVVTFEDSAISEPFDCPPQGVRQRFDGSSQVTCSGGRQRTNPSEQNRTGSASGRPKVAIPDVVRILGFGNDPATGLCFQPSGLTLPTAEYNAPANTVYRVWNSVVQGQFSRCPLPTLTPEEVAVGVVEAFPLSAFK